MTRESALYSNSKSLKSYYKDSFSPDKPMRQMSLAKGGYVYLKDDLQGECISKNETRIKHMK